MNASFVPPKQDANLILQASVTKAASFNSTGVDLGSGFAPGGFGQPVLAGIKITAIETDTGNETYTFHLEESDDDSSYTQCGQASASQSATGALCIGGFVSKRYVRLVLTAGGTIATGITYEGWLFPLPTAV